MRYALTLAWQEIRHTWKTPSFYFTAALFLFYQGIVLAVTLALRQHPLSPPGPLLAPFFGGPFWFWPMLILVVVELSHNAISRERAQNTLDALRASVLTPHQIVLGKYLAMLATWTLLWVATLPLLLFLWIILPPDVTVPAGPVLTGYAGVVLVGGAGLALGLFFSSLTADTRLSGMLTFVVLFAFVLVKIMTSPAFGIVRDPNLMRLLDAFNFFDVLERLSRGFVHLRDLTLLLTLIFAGVAGAGRVLGAGLRRRSRWNAVDLGAWTMLAALGFALVFRLGWTWDVTGRPELDPRLEQRIRETTEPVTLYLFTGSPSAAAPFSPVPELEVHLERVCRKSPLLRWERIQAASSGPRASALAARFGLNLAAMEADSTGILEGRLVAATAVRHHVIRLSDLFVMDIREDGVVFHGVALQSALSRGLARLQRPDDASWCFTRGHQERQITDTSASGLARLAAGLQFSGISTREIDLLSPVPTNCRLLFSTDPQTDLMSAEEENLATALREGRTGLVLATHEYNQLPASWKRPFQDCHLGFSDTVAEDPRQQLRSGEPGRFLVPWPGRNGRLLLTRPLIISTDRSAVPLLTTSDRARHIERGTGRVLEEKTAVLAARSGPDCASRILLLGFSDAFSNDRLTIGGQSSDASMNWLLTQLRWAAAEPPDETMPIFEMEHHKLVLPQSQVARIQTFALLLWPLFALAVGLWVARRRRA
ncbi:ABC transporter permease [Myxococcota bacterium]|nr:ABC transporter permease [Myxococcota bacterium]